jgi:putative membrane-bound dehydrogenase-like protein
VILAALAVQSVFAADFVLEGRKFTVPDGFTVERVTTTQLTARPVSASFDDQGRLYVTESDGSNEAPAEQLKHPGARVLRLEDTNGDGVFDRSRVFADKVMFPQGCLWHDGWVYVAGPPSIWRFADTDGDGVADRREEWFKGGSLTGCANDIHGPHLGPDGFIYWTKGAFEEQTHPLANGRILKDRAAHIYRMRPDGTGLDVVMSGGMDNPVEVAFTPEGEVIFSSTFIDFSQPGFRDGLAHAVYGGVFGKVNDVLEDGRVKRTGPDLMQPFFQAGPAAECGLMRYESDVFGPDYRDNLFATTFNLHKVTRHVLRPAGATFASTDSDFLVCDDVDFHPTDVLEDADGSLLVVDTGGWYKLCCPSSQLVKPDVFGALYRVRKTAAPRLEDPLGLKVDWSVGAMTQVAARLADPRPAVRQRAQRTLVSFGPQAVPVLVAQLQAISPELRRNTVWALTQINDPAGLRALRPALSDADSSVAQTALKATATLRNRDLLDAVTGALAGRHPPVLRAAVEAFGRLATGDLATRLLNPPRGELFSPNAADAVLEHSIIFALIELADPAGTRLGLSHREPAAQRAALIALDQMDGGKLVSADVVRFLGAPDERLRAAAHWILGRHPEWGGELAGWFRQQLTTGNSGLVAALEAQLHMLTRAAAGQTLLADAVTEPGFADSTRQAALGAVAQAGLKQAPAAWKTATLTALTQPALRASAVRAARSLNAEPAIQAALLAFGRTEAQPANLRLEALAALPGGLGLSATDVAFARRQLQPEQSPTTRSTAAGVLGRARLEPAQLNELVAELKSAGPLELNRLLGAFAGGGDETLGLKVVAALREAKSAQALPPTQLRPQFAKFPAAVQTAAESFLATLNVDAAKQAAHLDSLLTELMKLDTDPRRGQAVFNGSKAACSACHQIGYLGGNVGPSLTEIGKARTVRDLLEAIVYPSASFVRSYEPTLITLQDGEQLNGLVKRETADELVVVTGPGAEQHLRRTAVAETQPGTISVMPGGLDEQLTRLELADLLRFMKDVRWK